MIEQPVIDRLGFTGESPIEIEPGHVPLVLQAASGQSSDEIGQIVRRGLADLAHLTQRSELNVAYTLARFHQWGYIEPTNKNLSQ